MVIEPLDPVDDVLGLGQGEHAARESQPHQLHRGQPLAAVGVALLGESTPLHTPHAAANVQCAHQRSGGVLLLGDVADKLARVQMRTQTAAGGNHGDAVVIQGVDAVAHELGTLGDDIHIHALLKAHGHGLDLPHGHAAVGEEAFEHGDQVLHGEIQVPVPDQDDAAPCKAEFPGGEIDDIKEVRHHAGDLPDGFVRHALLAGFDKVEVVLEQRGVQNRQNAVFFADIRSGLHVGVGDRLAADEVGPRLQAHEGDILRGFLFDALLQLFQVDVALEGEAAFADQALVLDQFLHPSAYAGDVGLSGGKVVIHDDAVAGFDEAGSQDVLAGPALVGGEAVGDAKELVELLFHTEIALAAGIGVVGAEHGRFHIVAHGVDAGVSKHIQEDVAVVKLEGIETGLPDLFQPLPGGEQVQFLNNPHLVHLQRDGVVFIKCNLSHVCSPLMYVDL